MHCPECGGSGVTSETTQDDMRHTSCPMCGATISRSGLKVEGTSYWQVLVVAGGLIALLFVLAVAWKLIFG